MNYIDESLSDEEEQQIKQSFNDGVESAKVLFGVASDHNMSPRQLAIANMLVLTIVSKHEGIAIEPVIQMLKNIWDGMEISIEDLH